MTLTRLLAAAAALGLGLAAAQDARALDGLPKYSLPALVGIYNATPPVLSDGQQGSLQLDASGNLKVNVAIGGGTGGGGAAGTTSNAADGVATSAANGATVDFLYAFNGTTFDRLRLVNGALAVDTVVRSTPVSRSAILPVQAAAASSVAGGTGNVVGDVLTEVGGTASAPAKFTVAAVTSGAVTAVTPLAGNLGSYTVLPTNPVTTTSSGSGSGATLTVSYAGLALQLAPANPARRGLSVQPQGGVAYLSMLAAATADFNALKIGADQLYETPNVQSGTGAVSMIAAGAVPLPVYAREF